MISPIFVKDYSSPQVNKKEVLRYAGVKSEVDSVNSIINECLNESKSKLFNKVCYVLVDVKIDEDIIDFGFSKVRSKSLAKNLRSFNKAIIFSATIGVEIDRLIAKYNVVSPVKALIFQAIGAERIESLCNVFNEDIKGQYKEIAPRFSAGYGDLNIEFQRDIFKLLDCHKKIGLTLNDSLIMSPSKSVTAIIGVK